MNRTKKITMALMALLLLLLAACGTTNEQSDANTDNINTTPSDKVRIGYVNVMDDAQVMLAKDAGIYQKHGLDVELTMFSSGTDLIKSIVGGQLDAGVLGFTNAATWSARGADLKVVGGAQMGYHSILVRDDSGIQTVADLKGKSLASQKEGSTADIVLNGVTLKEAGLSKKDLNMVYVSPSVAVQSLAAGKVDAAFLFEPYDRIASYTSPVSRIYEIGDVWPFPCMVVITSAETLEGRKDVIHRVLDAQKEAIEMLNDDPARAAEYLAHRFIEGDTLDTPDGPVAAVDIITEAIQSQTFTWEITPEQIDRMQEIADIMLEQGVLEEQIDVKQILDLTWQQQQQQ